MVDKCPICNQKMHRHRYVPSPLDDIKLCPKCGSRNFYFMIPESLGSCVVGCRCEDCGHDWSIDVVLPKNLLGKK